MTLCHRHSGFTMVSTPSAFWSSVLFSDKSRDNQFFNDDVVVFTGGVRNVFQDDAVVMHNQYGAGSIMVWDGITDISRTQLHIVAGNLNIAPNYGIIHDDYVWL